MPSPRTPGPRWIELDGAENARDLGGLPTGDGGRLRPGRLIRSDSLQQLSAADVRRLVDEIGVRSVADLRTGVEVAAEGPGPMTAEPLVRIEHLSLFPEAGGTTDAVAADSAPVAGAPVVLPWQSRTPPAGTSDDERRRGAAGVYLRYLDDRADSVLAALRLIAGTDGATIVHCAAGKDRTGVVVAIALAEVGVPRAAIVADYAASGERIEAILRRLVARPTYSGDLTDPDGGADYAKHRPRPETMERLLDAMDELHGGVVGWLRDSGWTEQDAAALRDRLIG